MKYRTLGKTGIKVSEIGFGGWGIGGDWWKDANDGESIRSLELAKELGVTLFDSALQYGNGHSETLIGSVIRKDRGTFVITSKIPPKNFVYPPKPGSPVEEAFPAAWIVECTERSLKNYGVDCIDLQQFHVWINEWGKSEELRKAVEKLKRDGKVKAFGCSINFPYEDSDNALPDMTSGLFDAVQVVYNIYEQDPEKDVFRTALKHHVGVIARCPLDEGALSGKITPDAKFTAGSFLDSYFKEDRKRVVYDKARKLEWLVSDGHAESLAEGALRYVLGHPAVSSVIVGMRNPGHATENCAFADKGPLSAEVRKRLKKYAWHHNYWV